MQTDKELSQIFRACPEMIFLLAHLPAPRDCKLTSDCVKNIQRTMDGLIIPEDLSEPITVIEIQFQRSLDIYQRIIVEMALVQPQNPSRMVQGIICFAEAALDPSTEPWKSSGLVRRVYLKDEIEQLERQMPEHPLVAVFKPIFETSQDILEKEAVIHYRHLQQSALDPEQRKIFCDAFISLLAQRLSELTPEALAMILELPGIENTVCGRELLARSEAKGQIKELLELVSVLATRKFGPLPSDVVAGIQHLDHAQGTELFNRLLDMSDLAELEFWLRQHIGK